MLETSIAPLPPEIIAKIDSEIDAVIARDGRGAIAQIEQARLRYWRYARIIKPISLIAFLPCYIGSIVLTGGYTFFLFLLWFLLALGINKLPQYLYSRKTRGRIMPLLVEVFGDFHWQPEPSADLTERLKRAYLFGSFSRLRFTDFIWNNSGSITTFIMRVKMLDENDKGAGNLFDGVAAYVQLPAKSEGSIIIRSRHAASNLFNPLPDKNWREVTLPYDDFSNVFKCYSDDQMLGRTLLTPDVAEELVKLARLFNDHALSVSRIENVLALGLNGARQLEFFTLKQSVYELNALRNAARQIYMLLSLVNAVEKAWKVA